VARYYLDIETYSKGSRPNPIEDEIITIQFQKMNAEGKAIDQLNILKAWEHSEESIVNHFYNRFYLGKREWDFVPVGFNLSFEFDFLRFKFAKYLGKNLNEAYFHSRPYVDLKHFVILMNRGEFKGSGLDKFSKKKCNGSAIRGWYEKKDFGLIENYITEETDAFLELYQNIVKNSEKWKKDLDDSQLE